jgi:NAD-dependent dihydropyrimidine dehydrogenase PreA subunit
VDVCPENLIRLVGLSQLVTDPVWLDRAQAEFGDLSRFSPEELDQLGAVMMKDESSCIRCALCASRCPTHAILMKHFEFHRECVTVETRNPKVRYAP